jgi:hydroxypyruvate isomerase
MALLQSVCIPIMVSDEFSQEKLIEQSAEIGYAAVEFWGRGDDFDATCDLAKSLGLRVISFIGHGDTQDGLNNPSNHKRIEDELRISIDVAAAKNIPGMICFSGNRVPEMSDDEAMSHTVTGLRRVARYAEDNGVTLNLELLNSKVDHVGYQCDRTSWAVSAIEQVGSPNVKVLYDIYHMQIMEGDVIRTLVDNLDSIGHIHTAGNPGRRDLDGDQELNYRGIACALVAAGYVGYVGHEFRPKGDAVAALRQAYESCKGE